MKRKRFGALLLALTLTLSLIAPGTCPTVHAMTVLETDTSTASDGRTMLGIYGSYYSNAKEALDKINDIRYEACTAGNVPDPRNPERMLTPSDYSPLKWSSDLERVARIRLCGSRYCLSLYGFRTSAAEPKRKFQTSSTMVIILLQKIFPIMTIRI